VPSPASVVLRAIRRLAATDPGKVARPDFGELSRAWIAAAADFVRRAANAARLAVDEVLGGERTLVVAPVDAPEPIGGSTAGERAMAFLATHRRSATGVTCLVIVMTAAVAGMPAASAARVPTGGPDTASIDTNDQYPAAGDDLAPTDRPVEGELGDGAVYNVLQPVDEGQVGGRFRVYVVTTGDTLAGIGARFGLTRNTVYWANTAHVPDPSSLRVGQKLTIPPANGVTVTVKDGDTLSGLAATYKSTVKAIQTVNGLTGTTLTVGQVVLVPVTPPAIPAATPGSDADFVWTGTRLRWPVPYSHTVTKGYSAGHKALDIAGQTGTRVIASIGGKVIFAGWKYGGGGAGGGLEIWINSGGKVYTTYNHLSRVYVKVGEIVPAGMHIGNVGMTGNATGPHLHFETWICAPWTGGDNSCARNPLRFM
jgi:murein DD-endopeptidase MepM/ murein hydrolase activator NlpD